MFPSLQIARLPRGRAMSGSWDFSVSTCPDSVSCMSLTHPFLLLGAALTKLQALRVCCLCYFSGF